MRTQKRQQRRCNYISKQTHDCIAKDEHENNFKSTTIQANRAFFKMQVNDKYHICGGEVLNKRTRRSLNGLIKKVHSRWPATHNHPINGELCATQQAQSNSSLYETVDTFTWHLCRRLETPLLKSIKGFLRSLKINWTESCDVTTTDFYLKKK